MHFIIMYDCLSKISPLNLHDFIYMEVLFSHCKQIDNGSSARYHEVNDSGEKYYFKMSLPKSLLQHL